MYCSFISLQGITLRYRAEIFEVDSILTAYAERTCGTILVNVLKIALHLLWFFFCFDELLTLRPFHLFSLVNIIDLVLTINCDLK